MPEGSLGIEVAFPQDEGDATHVRVVVSRRTESFERHGCGRGENGRAAMCEESTTQGVRTVLAWERGTPEEDPGVIGAAALHDGWLVTVGAYGPFVRKDLGNLRPLADDLIALAADPAVGYRTSDDYAAAGENIGDDVWLDWYGQGNGAPPPQGYEGPS